MLSFPLDLNVVVFENAGRKHLFSGSSLYLFAIDDVVADIVSETAKACSENAVMDALAPRHGEPAVRGGLDEIERLMSAGVLAPLGAPLRVSRDDPGLSAQSVELTDLWLILTNACNLNCAYCFSRAEYMNDRSVMSPDTAKTAVNYLLAHSGSKKELSVIFFGGEPLLNIPVMKETVTWAKAAGEWAGKRFSFSITTNGVKLTPETRRFLIEERFSVMISLDGEQAQHDASRPFLGGRGSFSTIAPLARAYVEEARAEGLFVHGRTTLNRTHLGRIVELYQFLDEDMGFSAVTTPIIHEPAPPGFAFLQDDVPRLEEEFFRLADVFVERCGRDGKAPPWGTLATFLNSIHHRARPARGCAAGRLTICVDTGGAVYPCERFITEAEYALGDVRTSGYDMEKVHRLSRLDAVGYYGKCKFCAAVHYCKGTCAAERARYHPAEGPDEAVCEIYRALMRVTLGAYVRIDHDALLPPLISHERSAA